MESSQAMALLAALSQKTRLAAFKVLVRHEPDGVAAGELACLVGVPQNTLSTHLAILARAGLVAGARHSRSVIYRARLEAIQQLVLHLLQDCCNGSPAFCAPLAHEIAAQFVPQRGYK